MPRVAAAIGLALMVASCTLLESRDGLVGPPLADDGGAIARGDDAAAEGSPAPPGDDGAIDATDEAPPAGPAILYAAQDGATGITVRGDFVYWVAGQPRGLLRAPRRGGPASSVQHLDALTQPIGDAFDLAVDDAYVYWSTRSDARTWRRALGGGANEPCFAAPTGAAYVALGPGGLYVTDFRQDAASVGQGTIVFGACGATPTAIFGTQPRASGIAASGDLLYWGRNQPDAIAFATLADGGAPSTFHGSTGAVDGVAVDDVAVYWLRENRRVMRFDFATRTETELYDAGNPFGDGDVAVDDEAIYWTEHDPGVVMRMPKPKAM